MEITCIREQTGQRIIYSIQIQCIVRLHQSRRFVNTSQLANLSQLQTFEMSEIPSHSGLFKIIPMSNRQLAWHFVYATKPHTWAYAFQCMQRGDMIDSSIIQNISAMSISVETRAIYASVHLPRHRCADTQEAHNYV